MSKDTTTTTDRAELLRAAGLVRPAVAEKAYIPALTHIAFNGEWATAYNDRLAIAVRCNVDVKRLVPGALFIQGLNAFGGNELLVQQTDDKIVLRSGRSRVTLPTLPLSDFPFAEWPDDGDAIIRMPEAMLKAMERCLFSVNADATKPAQMGVTLDMDDEGQAVFFSTDNHTVSRSQCSSKIKLPGGVPVILPRAFCEQLIVLSKSFPDADLTMGMGSGFVDAVFERKKEMVARTFARIPVDPEPLAFPKTLQRHCGDLDKLKKRTTTIPEELDAALARALLVLGAELRKRATVKINDGVLSVRATSDFGDTDDTMKIDLDDVGPVPMDAGLVARGLKLTSRMQMTDTVTILTNDDITFVHMVAHIRDLK